MSETARSPLCRVRSAGQEDNTVLATQETACRAWASQRGLPVAAVAHEVWSGGDRHRPEASATLLDRLDAGRHCALLRPRPLVPLAGGHGNPHRPIESAGASLALVTEDFEKSATGTFYARESVRRRT